MDIILLESYSGGGRPPIQSWPGKTPPDGYAEVACDTAEFTAFRSFVNLTIVDGVVAAIAGNQVALDAYLAAHPDTELEQPVDDITALQLAIAELAEAQATDQTNTELAIAELAELVTGGGS